MHKAGAISYSGLVRDRDPHPPAGSVTRLSINVQLSVRQLVGNSVDNLQ